MKKIINILTFIFIIVLYHLTKTSNTFLLTFSFSLFLIYYSIFSSNKIKKLLNDYYDKKYLYTMNKVFKCSILLIIILTMLLGVISYIISTLINIEKLYLVNIAMTIFLSISLIIKLINNYLNIFGYKKNILWKKYRNQCVERCRFDDSSGRICLYLWELRKWKINIVKYCGGIRLCNRRGIHIGWDIY